MSDGELTVTGQVKNAVNIVLRHVASIAVVIALMWGIARPHAQDFIRDTVDERITQLERRLTEVRLAQQSAAGAQARIEAELNTLTLLQAEARNDVKALLREVRRNGN